MILLWRTLAIFFPGFMALLLTAYEQPAYSAEVLPALQLQSIPLTPEEDSPPIGYFVQYVKPFTGSLDHKTIASHQDRLLTLNQKTINFGPPFGRVMAVFSVENTSNISGEWILTTGRGALNKFKLVEVSDQGATLLIDGNDTDFVGEMLQTYHSFTHRFHLQPSEQKQFALTFQGRHSTFLPLQIRTVEGYYKTRFGNIALVTGSFIGMMILIIISILLYTSTSRPEFLWVSGAEIFHAMHLLHIEGYTTFYVLYKSGEWIYTVGNIFPLGYSIAMAQFGRSFLKTKENFPFLNLCLKGLIWGGIVILAGLFVSGFFETTDIDPLISFIAGLPSCLVLIILPYIAIVATLRLDRYYWPLIVAWGTLALFVFYATLAATGVLQWLPFNWHITGPMALFQTFFAVLAVILHVKTINEHNQKNIFALTQSMQKELATSNEAARLAEEKAAALATVRDQGNLLHASGHDSQQVLLALNSVINFAETSNASALPDNLLNMLKSSSAYLNDIVSTTMSAPLAHAEAGQLVVLSRFQLHELIRPLEMIYRPMIIKKGIKFSVTGDADLWLVSDRASLSRVISNLLSNALKFTTCGDIRIDIQQKKQEIVLSVHDTGKGMTVDLRNQLLEQSQLRIISKEKNRGSGFGLRSSLKLIAALKGVIDVESELEEGTTISVRLPVVTIDHPDLEPGNEVTIARAQDILSDVFIFDADAVPKSKLEERAELKNFTASHIIPVTYDDSTQMRGWGSGIASLIFLKPMQVDYLYHPILAGMRVD